MTLGRTTNGGGGFAARTKIRIIDVALNDSPGLQAAADRLGEADALARVEGARMLPFIDADAGMRQSRVPSHGVVAGYNPRQAGLEKTMAFINPLSFRYEFDFWGKNRAAFDAALGEAAAAEAEVAEARLVLTASIARTNIRGAALAAPAIGAEMVEARRELLHLAELRVNSGLDTEDAVIGAELNSKSPTKGKPPRRRFVLQQDLLARLMGDGPDATRNLFETSACPFRRECRSPRACRWNCSPTGLTSPPPRTGRRRRRSESTWPRRSFCRPSI